MGSLCHRIVALRILTDKPHAVERTTAIAVPLLLTSGPMGVKQYYMVVAQAMIYAIATVFQLYLRSDMMHDMRIPGLFVFCHIPVISRRRYAM